MEPRERTKEFFAAEAARLLLLVALSACPRPGGAPAAIPAPAPREDRLVLEEAGHGHRVTVDGWEPTGAGPRLWEGSLAPSERRRVTGTSSLGFYVRTPDPIRIHVSRGFSFVAQGESWVGADASVAITETCLMLKIEPAEKAPLPLDQRLEKERSAIACDDPRLPAWRGPLQARPIRGGYVLEGDHYNCHDSEYQASFSVSADLGRSVLLDGWALYGYCADCTECGTDAAKAKAKAYAWRTLESVAASEQ